MTTMMYRKPSPVSTDWILDDPYTWSLSGTADAFEGTHLFTGMSMRSYRDIRISATDLEPVEDPDDGDWEYTRAWWWKVVEAAYDYDMMAAEIDYDRETELLAGTGYANLQEWADGELGTGDYELDADRQREILGRYDALIAGKTNDA